MNRRDFLKLLGVLPLVSLALKVPEYREAPRKVETLPKVSNPYIGNDTSMGAGAKGNIGIGYHTLCWDING